MSDNLGSSSVSAGELEVSFSKMSIYKNVVVLSTAFFLLFAAFQAVSSLQTSINSQQGLGSTSLSLIYACLIVSCLLLPELVIGFLTIKWTLVLCICCYGAYIFANVAPSWYTLMPTSIMVGLAAGPLWTSESTYITEMGTRLDSFQPEATAKSGVSLLFGIFYCFFQSGAILGNLISSLTLQTGTRAFSIDFEPGWVYESRASSCGGNYCPSKVTTANSTFAKNDTSSHGLTPSASKIYLLCSVYTGMSVASALIIALFLKNYSAPRSNGSANEGVQSSEAQKLHGVNEVKKDRMGDESPVLWEAKDNDSLAAKTRTCCKNRSTGKPINVWEMCFATVKQMRDPRQILLIPLSMYSGLQQGFMAADYTKSYVTCIYGVKYIGFTMMAYGIVNALISPTSGYLNKKVPRWVLFGTAAILHFSIFPVLAFRTVKFAQNLYLVFVIAGLWGAFDGILQPQINALYGSIFLKNREPAFSNHRLWESLGFIMSFGYHDFLCIKSKLFILFGLLLICCCTYISVEILQKVREKNMPAEVLDNQQNGHSE